MEPIRLIQARTVALPIDNIDTDQIIPARFLKVTDRKGLGRWLFSDWRYAPDGAPRPEFVLNGAAARDAGILVAGDNFGCGSSREHAPWALHDFGFRAVVSTSFASIFRNNALKNGLLPIVVEPDLHRRLLREPALLTIDLEARTVALPDGTAATFPIEPFARYCLLNGMDELSFLLQREDEIGAWEKTRPA